MTVLGHDVVGAGSAATPVIVMNDWLCDTSTWDVARGFINRERLTWVFADLRGYGRSRSLTGAFDLRESASDVIALADALRLERFAVVGHSMSTLIALHLAQNFSKRVSRVVVITPPPPSGFGADEAAVEQSRQLAMADDATRLSVLSARGGGRLSDGWVAYKAKRWRETSDPAAVASYVAMYARDGLPDLKTKIAAEIPVLAITGEEDFEPMRSAAVKASLSPLCENLEVIPIKESGHYPMQETPPLFIKHIESFLLAPPT